MDSRADEPTRRSHAAPSLEAACAELNRLMLEGAELDDFLRRFAESVRRDRTAPVAEVDPTTGRQEPAGDAGIPGQRAPRPEGERLARQAGPESGKGRAAAERPANGGVSIPLIAGGADMGVLRLVVDSRRGLSDAEAERLRSFARLAAPAVLLMARESAHLELDDQLQEAVVTRAVIDQAMGVLMHARKISSHEAFEVLRQASQTTNRKVSEIAAEVIEALTGHPPEPPRPLSPRRAAVTYDPLGHLRPGS
jgi:hypothetical protein